MRKNEIAKENQYKNNNNKISREIWNKIENNFLFQFILFLFCFIIFFNFSLSYCFFFLSLLLSFCSRFLLYLFILFELIWVDFARLQKPVDLLLWTSINYHRRFILSFFHSLFLLLSISLFFRFFSFLSTYFMDYC